MSLRRYGLEGDTPGFNLGNGASGSILVEEPRNETDTPVPVSMGIVLASRPTGNVQLQFYEATNPTNVVNVNATRRRSLLQTAVPPAERGLTIISGQTLTFTEADWYLPHPVLMKANYIDGDQGRRITALCTTVVGRCSLPVFESAHSFCAWSYNMMKRF